MSTPSASSGLNLSQTRRLFLLLFLASAGALTAALIGERVFGLVPCILCLYERIPYAIVGLLSLIMIALPSSPRLRFLTLGLVLIIFVGSAGLSFFHVGVEQHWWASPACTGGSIDSLQLDDLRAALQKPSQPACDDIQWSFLGITLAGYNLIYSIALAAFCLGITLKIRRPSR